MHWSLPNNPCQTQSESHVHKSQSPVWDTTCAEWINPQDTLVPPLPSHNIIYIYHQSCHSSVQKLWNHSWCPSFLPWQCNWFMSRLSSKGQHFKSQRDLESSCSILGLSSPQASDLRKHIRQLGVWFALFPEEGPSEFHLDFSLYAVTWLRCFWVWCLLWQALSMTTNFYCIIQVLKHRATTRKGSFMLLKVTSFQTPLLWESASSAIFGQIILCIPPSLYNRIQVPALADSLWIPYKIFVSPLSWCMICPPLLPATLHGNSAVWSEHILPGWGCSAPGAQDLQQHTPSGALSGSSPLTDQGRFLPRDYALNNFDMTFTRPHTILSRVSGLLSTPVALTIARMTVCFSCLCCPLHSYKKIVTADSNPTVQKKLVVRHYGSPKSFPPREIATSSPVRLPLLVFQYNCNREWLSQLWAIS